MTSRLTGPKSVRAIATTPHVRSEKAEERLCDDLIARISGAGKASVIRFSQARATMQTPGIPDRRYALWGCRFWFEVKASNGKLSPAQRDFLIAELDAGCLAACGTLEDLAALVTAVRSLRGVSGLNDETGLIPFACRDLVAKWAKRGMRGQPK